MRDTGLPDVYLCGWWHLLVPCSVLFICQVGIDACLACALLLFSQLWPCGWDHLVENMAVSSDAGRLASHTVDRLGPRVDVV